MPHSSIRSRPTRPDQPRPAKSCSHGGIFMILRTKLSRRCGNASLWNRPICDRSENERHELSLASPDSPGILQDEQGQAEQQDRQCTENRHRNRKRPVVPEPLTAHVGKSHQAIRRHSRSQPDDRDQDLRNNHCFHLRRRPTKPYSRIGMCGGAFLAEAYAADREGISAPLWRQCEWEYRPDSADSFLPGTASIPPRLSSRPRR